LVPNDSEERLQMNVYIDESGDFISTPNSRVSCVEALAIPSARRDALFAAFARRRQQFHAGVNELKGSVLTEKRVAGVISPLLAHGALLEVCTVDMGVQAEAMTAAFKAAQAAKLFEHVTPLASVAPWPVLRPWSRTRPLARRCRWPAR
jgi:hypothetical protein